MTQTNDWIDAAFQDSSRFLGNEIFPAVDAMVERYKALLRADTQDDERGTPSAIIEAFNRNIELEVQRRLAALRSLVVPDARLYAEFYREQATSPTDIPREARELDAELGFMSHHVHNLAVLQMFRTRALAVDQFGVRFKMLLLRGRHRRPSELASVQLASAVDLYLWGFEKECIVYVFAALEAALYRHHADKTTGESGARPDSEAFIDLLLGDAPASLARRVHDLRRVRNRILHSDPRDASANIVSAEDALSILTDTLDYLEPWQA